MSCSSYISSDEEECTGMILYGVNDTLLINEGGYHICVKDHWLKIEFLASDLIDQIFLIECVGFDFYFKGNRIKVKSNPVFSSSLPKNADYYFSVGIDGIPIPFKEDNTISIWEIE